MKRTEASVDVVFICDTDHHFEFPQRMMTSLHKSLKPGGRVVVIDFVRTPDRGSDWVLKHVRAGQDVVEKEIAECGFRKVTEVKDLLKENYMVVFEKVPMPKAAEQPRKGARVVFDITADAKPGDVNKGLERVARLLNLYGSAGLKASDIKVAVVFHGEATRTVLADAVFKAKFGTDRNPNLPVLRDLRKAGVEVFVCGQALNSRGFKESDVVESVSVALAALTVVVNRQTDGYAYVPVN